MEFFKPGVTYDFFRYRWPFIITSLGLTFLSLVSLFWPGPRFGIDFKGGTEVELACKGNVSSSDLREATLAAGWPERASPGGRGGARPPAPRRRRSPRRGGG